MSASKQKSIVLGEDEEHSEFGASGSKMWMTCEGAIQMQRGEPNETNAASLEGTEAHKCLEILLKNRKKIEAAVKMVARKYNKDQVRHGEETVIEVERLMKKYKTEELYIETKVDSSKFTKEDQFGSLDVAIVSRKTRTLIIGDYKYGAGIFIDPTKNSQLIYYALAMLLKLGYKNFDTVILYVFQPRKADDDGETTRFWKTTTEEIISWGKKFKKAVKKAEAPDAKKRLTSGEHCRFCRARIKCPKLKEESMKQAMIDFAPATNTIKKIPNVKEIQNIGKVLDACNKLQMFINAVKERAYNDAKRGLKVEGYKLVEKRTTRSWKNEIHAEKVLKKHLGEDAFTKPKLLSPAQIEKKFAKKQKAKEWLRNNVTNKTGGTTLAHESNKKKGINIFEAEFTVVGED